MAVIMAMTAMDDNAGDGGDEKANHHGSSPSS